MRALLLGVDARQASHLDKYGHYQETMSVLDRPLDKTRSLLTSSQAYPTRGCRFRRFIPPATGVTGWVASRRRLQRCPVTGAPTDPVSERRPGSGTPGVGSCSTSPGSSAETTATTGRTANSGGCLTRRNNPQNPPCCPLVARTGVESFTAVSLHRFESYTPTEESALTGSRPEIINRYESSTPDALFETDLVGTHTPGRRGGQGVTRGTRIHRGVTNDA